MQWVLTLLCLLVLASACESDRGRSVTTVEPSIIASPTPTRPHHRRRRGSGAWWATTAVRVSSMRLQSFFSDNLLQDVPIEHQVRHQLLQLAVFMAQRPQLADL